MIWIKHQVDRLQALQGCTVSRWAGIEMAVREIGPDGWPQWYDESVSALQLDRLDLIFSGGSVASIVTYQNDDRWGLYRNDDLPPNQVSLPEPESIFRSRFLDELPVGEIVEVNVLVDEEGDIAKVRLVVEGHEVMLRSGEVYEEWSGELRTVEMDESILVQVDGRRPSSIP